MTKLSVITINRNDSEGLRRTIQSVITQTSKDFEFVIVDGASTDNSMQTLFDCLQVPETNQTTHGKINVNGLHVLWISEPDTGIYNAMNKGIRMSSGEYGLMLNSADSLHDERVVEHILPLLHTDDIIQGNVQIEKNGIMQIVRGYGKTDITFFEALNAQFLHQASFIRKDLYDRYGYYLEDYRKNSDTYFYITSLALGNATFRYEDVTVALFDMNGISNNEAWNKIDKEEDQRFYREHLSPRIMEVWRNGQKKIAFYDTLHKHSLSWKLAVLLKVIANKF